LIYEGQLLILFIFVHQFFFSILVIFNISIYEILAEVFLGSQPTRYNTISHGCYLTLYAHYF